MKHLVYILFLFAAVACSTTPSSSGLKTITLREVQSKPLLNDTFFLRAKDDYTEGSAV